MLFIAGLYKRLFHRIGKVLLLAAALTVKFLQPVLRFCQGLISLLNFGIQSFFCSAVIFLCPALLRILILLFQPAFFPAVLKAQL